MFHCTGRPRLRAIRIASFSLVASPRVFPHHRCSHYICRSLIPIQFGFQRGEGSADNKAGDPQPDEAPNASTQRYYRPSCPTSGSGHGSNTHSPPTTSKIPLPRPLHASPISTTNSRHSPGDEHQCFSGPACLLPTKKQSISSPLQSPPLSVIRSPTNSRGNAPGTVVTSISHTEEIQQYGRGGDFIFPRSARWPRSDGSVRESGGVRGGDEGRENGDRVSGKTSPSSVAVASGFSRTTSSRSEDKKKRALPVVGDWTNAIGEDNNEGNTEEAYDPLNPSPRHSIRNEPTATKTVEKDVENQNDYDKTRFRSDDENNVSGAGKVVVAGGSSAAKQRDERNTNVESLHLLDVEDYESDFEPEGRE